MQRQSITEQTLEMLESLGEEFISTKKVWAKRRDPECYITKVVQKTPSIAYYMDQAYPVKPLVTFYKKHKVLPYGRSRKQAFADEKLKGVCYGCDDPNFNVEWIWNHEYSYYEVKNVCDECMACGNLEGVDCGNHL